MTSLNPVGVSAAAKAPCPVCGKSIHALDGAMSSGGEPMRHMDCERAASIDYAAAFDILYRRALDNQRTVNALVEVTTQEDGEPWEHDGLLMQLYSDDSTSWSTYESCVLAVAGSPADEHPGYQLLRVADEVLDKLEREGSEPVHILGVQRHDDGTIDLVCGTVAPAAIFPPGRLDAPLKADAWDEGFAAGWDNGRAAENARIVAALRAKGTHAADVLADQIEREAP